MEIKDWSESWDDETKDRASIVPGETCSFGIKPLDDALLGILKNDLIVIGADTGVGKSELCQKIALHNARMGKKVALYSLEGGDKEAMARLKWQVIRDKYYTSGLTSVNLDYRRWRMNLIKDPVMTRLEAECRAELQEEIKNNLMLYSIERGFTVKNLEDSMGWFMKQKPGEYGFNDIHYDVDLIIIDHLQYFTLTDGNNEYQETTNILTKVKEITDFYRIPVILVSHLRKKDRERGIPSVDDFIGTSNIGKIASVAITLAPDYAADNHHSQMYPTFMRIAKDRSGLRPSFAIHSVFDAKRGQYAKEYDIYTLIMDKPAKDPLPQHKLPKWAQAGVKKNEPKQQYSPGD